MNKTVGYWTRTPVLWNISGRLLLPDILLKSYSEMFWKIPKKIPLKKSCFHNDGGSRPETLLKHNHTVLKQVTYVIYMLQIISLTGTPHSWIMIKIFTVFPRYVTFLLIENKENLSNKENCFVHGLSTSWMFFIRAQNCSIF